MPENENINPRDQIVLAHADGTMSAEVEVGADRTVSVAGQTLSMDALSSTGWSVRIHKPYVDLPTEAGDYKTRNGELMTLAAGTWTFRGAPFPGGERAVMREMPLIRMLSRKQGAREVRDFLVAESFTEAAAAITTQYALDE